MVLKRMFLSKEEVCSIPLPKKIVAAIQTKCVKFVSILTLQSLTLNKNQNTFESYTLFFIVAIRLIRV